jgi:hypothetical protein
MIDLYPDCIQWRRQVIKHHGTDLTAQTKGKDWNEIADEWEARNQRHPITEWIEWSTGCVDYNRVYAGFASVSREHLLPHSPSAKTFRPVIAVTEARLVNTLTSTSLTSRSRVISALGRYNQKCGVVENERV